MCVKLESQMSHSLGTARPLRHDLQGQTEADATSLCLCEATWTKLFPRWSHTIFESVKSASWHTCLWNKGVSVLPLAELQVGCWVLQGACRLQSLIPKSWGTVMFHIYGTHSMMTHPLSTFGMRICFPLSGKAQEHLGRKSWNSAGTDCRAGAPWPLCSGFLWKCFKYC